MLVLGYPARQQISAVTTPTISNMCLMNS